ncbi:TonB-dependent receptor [Peristeroidobacter soli]|uniref:TonB-dependent receptor n=1 Tax=Peristeroidobacter soli TaxID=2497877 RepID=UPI00101E1900|nr:TonB-dependent receptor [Peristeroidobacter soli]
MRSAVALAIVCLSVVTLSVAEESKAVRTNTSIQAGGLMAALRTLSADRRIHIIFVNEDVSRLQTQGARGNLTVDEALLLLLDGTGLTFRYIDRETVSILPIAVTSASAVPREKTFTTRTEPISNGTWSTFSMPQVEAAKTASPTAAGTSQTSNGAMSLITEVIVTSRRFTESVRDVPISISAYDRKALDLAGVKDFSGVAQLTPGVTFSSTNNLIAIRGISSTAGAATTGVYIDDAPVHIRQFGSAPAAVLPAVFDLERIEVLRGPQGTLYGAGSQGGTVRFITPQPSLDSYHMYGRGEVAFTEAGSPMYEAGFAVGGPIVRDKLGFRIGAFNRDEGGWVDWIDYNTGRLREDDANSVQTSVYRAALTWMPIEGLSITPSVFHQDQRTANSSVMAQFWSDFGGHRFKYANNIANTNEDRFTLPGLRVEYRLGDYQLVSNTAWFERDGLMVNDAGIWRLSNLQFNFGFPLLTRLGPDDAVGVPYFNSPGRFTNDQRNFTQELRLQSSNPGARFTWVLGLYFSDAEQRNMEQGESGVSMDGVADYDRLYRRLFGQTVLQRFGFPLFDGKYSYVTDTWVWENQKAAFADATWKMTDRLSLSAGLRYSEMKFEFDAARASNTQAGWTYSGGKTKEFPVTPRFNLTYRATDELMMYANAGKGFRGGGANSAAVLDRCAQNIRDLGLGDVAAYDSDYVWSYDLGAKGKLIDGRVAYDVSAYVIDWSGIQQSNTLVACGGSYIGNFGEARAKGVDMMLQAVPVPDLLIDLSLGYMSSEYTAQVMSSAESDASVLISDGNSLPNVVPFKAALGVTYNFFAFDNASYVRAAYEYSSRRSDRLPTQDPTTTQYLANPPFPYLPETHMVRLRGGMDFGSYDVSVFVDNLLDSAPLLSRTSSTQSDFYQVSTWRPRTLGVTVVYRY